VRPGGSGRGSTRRAGAAEQARRPARPVCSPGLGKAALAAASPALALTAGNPVPDLNAGVPEPWPEANLPATRVPPAVHTVTRTVVVGGMPGWQIALIAVGAALLAAALADLARAAHRKTALSAA
jgi:hypothetical protein